MKMSGIFSAVGVYVVLAAVIFAAGCVSSDDTPLDPETAIIGTWISEGTYTASGMTYNQVYTFNDDNSGTLAASSNGKVIGSVPVYWAYAEEEEAYMAYTPSTGDYDYIMISDDGKTLRSEYGEVYTKK